MRGVFTKSVAGCVLLHVQRTPDLPNLSLRLYMAAIRMCGLGCIITSLRRPRRPKF